MKRLLKLLFASMTALVMCLSAVFVPVHADDEPVDMWRLYNPNSGEHFYTADANERDHLYDAGWNIEGVGWVAPAQGDEVYRLYNPNAGEHHYTMDANERDYLEASGWKYEGVGWYSGGSVVMKREYNPNAFACNHNYTTSDTEHNYLISLGWRDEGTCWNAVAGGSADGAKKHEQAAPAPAAQPQNTPADNTVVTDTTNSGPYVVTRYGKKFHHPNCPTVQGRTIAGQFNTRDEAMAAGYEPCKDCNS